MSNCITAKYTHLKNLYNLSAWNTSLMAALNFFPKIFRLHVLSRSFPAKLEIYDQITL